MCVWGGCSWYQSFCIYLCVGMHVSAFDMNQAADALTAVSLHHGHSCSDAFNLVFTLVSSSQTQRDKSARKRAPSQILYSSLDAWDRFETVGPRQASLHFNWVPGHLKIHVSIGHMGYWSKWHRCPTSWVRVWGREGEPEKITQENSRFEKQSVKLLVNHGQRCPRLNGDSAVLQLWMWQPNTQPASIGCL